jgi:glycosyltransferase involved in cell wall biosynthesis
MFFTLITVTLNSEKTILKTINSINNQTYKEFEYIIVDGGSSDKTLQIIKKNLKKKYILISEKDKGIYNAMNKGINLSNGKFVGFLNSDDWLDDNILSKIHDLVKTQNPSIIYGDAKFYKNNKYNFYAKANLKKLKKDMSLLHSSFYVNSNIIKNYLFDENLIISSDYKQMLNLNKDYNFYYISESLSNVSMGGKSSDLLISSNEFFLIQMKELGLFNALFNYFFKYHYHIIKILILHIKRFF